MTGASQETYRTLTGKDTVPSSINNVLNGTVSTNAVNDNFLDYAGTSNVATFFNEVQFGLTGSAWAYIPTVAPYLARVTGIANTGTNTWTIQLDRSFAGVAGQSIYSCVGDLKKFSISNQGGAAFLLNGQSVLDGSTVSDEQFWNFKMNTLDAIAIDATGTSLLIKETR